MGASGDMDVLPVQNEEAHHMLQLQGGVVLHVIWATSMSTLLPQLVVRIYSNVASILMQWMLSSMRL